MTVSGHLLGRRWFEVIEVAPGQILVHDEVIRVTAAPGARLSTVSRSVAR